MYSEKTKFYTHPELGIQTVALKDGQVYFIPKDFTGRFGYKCNDALVRRLCKGQRMLMVPVGPDTRKMRKVLGVPATRPRPSSTILPAILQKRKPTASGLTRFLQTL